MSDFGTLTVAVAAPLAVGAEAAEALADEHVKLLAYLAGTVVAVVAVIAWIDRRIDKKNAAQTRLLIKEMRAWQRLLAVRLGVRELMPEPEITDEMKITPGS